MHWDGIIQDSEDSRSPRVISCKKTIIINHNQPVKRRFSRKDIDLHPRTGSHISLTITNPTSFGDFLKIKKQLQWNPGWRPPR